MSQMKREWTDAIENRRWDELERLAKWEPDQQLCDTIANLERGTQEKSDRKALRRILWIIEKAGFHPTPSEDEATPPESPAQVEKAFMMSADAAGDTPITYGYKTGSKYRWLTAYVHETKGIKRASEETLSVEEGEQRADRLQNLKAPPYFSSEVDPRFALARIKSALSKNRQGTIPEAVAFWRTVIDKAEDFPHPSYDLKASKTTPAEQSEDVLLMDATMSWRIELGAATPILEQMYEAQQANIDQGEEAQREAVKEAGVVARRVVLTPGILADHAMRLRDLAYLMHSNGDEDYGKVLADAEDLEKKGPDSEYAKGLVDKTVVIYVETMKRAEKSSD
jgi:hypothetical protein